MFFPTVSVIIPIYNGEFDLPDLIRCLVAQTYPADQVEYLLVDNASQDKTGNIIQNAVEQAKYQGLIFSYLKENQIQSSYAARNTGILSAKGEFLVFTDVDCRPQPDWLYELIQPFINPKIGLVAGSIESLPGNTLLEKYASEKNPLSVENSLSNTFCPYIVTANLGVRYAVFYQVGLFRSHLTTGGDIDFSWRVLRQTSWQYFYAKKAVILHRHRANFKDLKKQWKRYGKGIYYLEKIYGIDIDNTEISIIKDIYGVGLFLLKLPIKVIKLITGKSTLLEFFSIPIELVIRYSYQSGKHNAKLSEEAMQIPKLNIVKPVLKSINKF